MTSAVTVDFARSQHWSVRQTDPDSLQKYIPGAPPPTAGCARDARASPSILSTPLSHLTRWRKQLVEPHRTVRRACVRPCPPHLSVPHKCYQGQSWCSVPSRTLDYSSCCCSRASGRAREEAGQCEAEGMYARSPRKAQEETNWGCPLPCWVRMWTCRALHGRLQTDEARSTVAPFKNHR